MLNLIKELPTSIVVDGMEYRIKTDYRHWLALGIGDISWIDIFEDKIPNNPSKAIGELFQFMIGTIDCNDIDENDKNMKSPQYIDYILDGDFIFAGFLQAYGIDLMSIPYLHWYKFVALVKSLPENTLMHKIISYRAYDGDDEELNKLKHFWELPMDLTEEEKDAERYFESLFGGE